MPGSRGLLPTRFLPLPRCHRLRIDPLPALRRPRLLLQIPQHRLPAPVLLIPPCQPGANKFLVQVAPIRQDGLGGDAFVPVDVADLHRDRLSESQIPGELLGACRVAASAPAADPAIRSHGTIVHHKMLSPARRATTLQAKFGALMIRTLVIPPCPLVVAEQMGTGWNEPGMSEKTWPVLGGKEQRWRVRSALDAIVAKSYGLTREQYKHILSTFNHTEWPETPTICLTMFDEIQADGLQAFTKKYDPYWAIPLNESLPQPVIDLPGLRDTDGTGMGFALSSPTGAPKRGRKR